MGEAATDSIRASVEGLLQALEKDTDSVPLKKDFCFYPCCSVELIGIIGNGFMSKINRKEGNT